MTKIQWEELRDKARTAARAVGDLELAVALAHKAADPKDKDILGDLLRAVTRGPAEDLAGLPYLLTPQPEWTGGDSTDPKNHRHKEPHYVGRFRTREYLT